MNPGAPQPYYAPPPPPPPQSSGMKWLVMGCGCILLVILLAVGSCAVAGYFVAKKIGDFAKAWSEATAEGEKYLKTNARVQEKLGKVARVTLAGHQNYDPSQPETQTFRVPYKVVGEKGEAEAEVEFTIKDFKPSMAGGYLYCKGKRIDLDTGRETDDERRPYERRTDPDNGVKDDKKDPPKEDE
jgi:hypothetical protein